MMNLTKKAPLIIHVVDTTAHLDRYNGREVCLEKMLESKPCRNGQAQRDRQIRQSDVQVEKASLLVSSRSDDCSANTTKPARSCDKGLGRFLH